MSSNQGNQQSSVKKTASAIHGAGEAIRGSINIMADRATGDHRAGSKDEATVRGGLDKMNQGRPVPGSASNTTTATGITSGVHPGVDASKPNLVEQGEHAAGNNPASSNYGPHSSGLANKTDPRVDSDLDNRGAHATTGGYGTAGHYGAGNNLHSSNYGPHSSNVANKADPRVDSDLDNRGAPHSGAGNFSTTGQYGVGDNLQSSNYGPHSSNLTNKADPRVDSDLDGRGAAGHTGPGYNASTASSGHTAHATGPHNIGNDPRSSNYGPHSSNLANKADPHVDSDLDNRGAAGHPDAGYNTTTHPGGQPGLHSDNPQSSNYGPHSSNLANKVDPRYDSDLDNRGATGHANAGYNTTHAGGQPGVYGDNPQSSNYGPHSSNLANTADPRYDSDLGNRGATGNVGPGYNTTANAVGQYNNPGSSNHGPHSSNLANKADPRVDSDLDGSRRGAY